MGSSCLPLTFSLPSITSHFSLPCITLSSSETCTHNTRNNEVICIAVPSAKMCHQLLTKNDRNPALKAAKWAAPALKTLSWNLKRFKPGWMSVFSGNVHEQVPARRWLFRKLLPRLLFVFPTYVLAHKSRFHVTLSFVLPLVVLSLFPQESHATDIYCFRRKRNWGRAADRSYYSFLVTGSSGAPQTEFIQPVPRPRGS